MRTRATSILLTLVTVAAGGALAAVGAYVTDHQGEQPALYVGIALAVRELSKYRDRLDPTRTLGKPDPPAGVSA